MSSKFQWYGFWCGPAYIILFGIACFSLAGFIPPPEPALTAQDVQTLFQNNPTGIRAAVIVGYIAALLQVPWSGSLAIQMARVEGRHPVLSVTAFGVGVANATAFFIPFMFWAGISYRVDRDPALMQLINDIAWLEFVMLYSPFLIQWGAIALLGFSDKSSNPTFPRWFCFMSIWVCILILPGGFVIFFEKGPFAWNGLVGFWIPVAAYSVYSPLLFWLVFKAIKRQELEE